MNLVTFNEFKIITVPCPAVTADSFIITSVQSTSGITAPAVAVVSRVPGVSFDLRSGRGGDVVTVGYQVIN